MTFSLVAAFVAGVAAVPAEEPNCLGVFLPRGDRVLRIMWVDVTGDKGAREAFAKAALEQGYTSKDLRLEDAKSQTHLTFISPRTTFAMADELMLRARKGEFGQLTVEPMVMRAEDGEMQKCGAR